jgi:hypothetical protein
VAHAFEQGLWVMQGSDFAGPSAGSALGAAKGRLAGQSAMPAISRSPRAAALVIEGSIVAVRRMHVMVAK